DIAYAQNWLQLVWSHSKMPVCLQIMHALKMHKGVNELRLLSNTLTYQSCVLFLHKVMVCARQRGILIIRKFV
ncbi:MAG: hypothetical protein UE667_02120, partial [Collinsella sp.]|nr:hypothetical protein [Collinsella sp.]